MPRTYITPGGPAIPLTLLALVACGDGAGLPTDETGTSGIVLTEAGVDSDTGSTENSETDGAPTTGDADTDTGTGTGTDTDTDTGDCESLCGCVDFEPRPPNIMFVLDKSGSMFLEKYHWNGEPRWKHLHGVVSDLALEYGDLVHLGAQLFPSIEASSSTNGPEACTVTGSPELPVAPGNGEALIAAIPAADETELGGGTPAERGIAAAADHLVALDDPGPKYMILVTDGLPNCSTLDQPPIEPDPNLAPSVAEARAGWQGLDEIPTLVVGIGIEDALAVDTLNAVAEAGGAPREGAEKFYNSGDAAELHAGLEAVLEDLYCIIDFGPDGLPPLTKIRIEVDGIEYFELPDGGDCGVEDGWMRTGDEDPTMEIRLCGQACADHLAAAELNIVFECIPPG